MELLEATISGMSDWSNQLVLRFATQLRAQRHALGLSAQDLADRTEQLGHPVSRGAIADYEVGRRKDRLMLGDAVVLAAALRMPLAALMYPHTPDGEVDVLPDHTTTSWFATRALIGDPGARPQYEFEGETPEQRQREYTEGITLYARSADISQLRRSIESARRFLEDAHARGDIAAVDEWQARIDDYRDGIATNAAIIREYGGVVDDG